MEYIDDNFDRFLIAVIAVATFLVLYIAIDTFLKVRDYLDLRKRKKVWPFTGE